MPIIIRPLLAGDRPDIVRILEGTQAFTPVDVQVAIELLDCYLEAGIGSGYHIWLAELDGRAAGYICYGPTPPHNRYLGCILDRHRSGSQGPWHRHRPFEFAEQEIRQAAGRMILIETASNPLYLEARRFYLARGYIIVSSIPDFYSPGDNKITFRKLI